MNWPLFWDALLRGYVTFPTRYGYMGIHVLTIAGAALLLAILGVAAGCAVATFTKKQSR